MREALAEARFLQSVEEDEDRRKGKVFTVKEEVKPMEEPKVELNQVVKACMKQLQALKANKRQSERARSAQKRLRCWCCKEMGHLMRACPTPVTSPLRPPKTPAAQMRQNSWRIYDRKEVCFCIRMLKPLKTEKGGREIKR